MSTPPETKAPVAKAPKTRKPPARVEAAPSAIRHAQLGGDRRHAALLVQAGKGAGAPIPPAARRRLDDHLGHRFHDVRVHTGDFARRTTRALDANAFTVGRDIFFAAGKYAPEEPAGYARLAHEAAHTVQQRSAGPARPAGRLEAEADHAVLAHSATGLSATGPLIQCEPTSQRRATGAALLREAERVLKLDPDTWIPEDPTESLWDEVGSNFPAVQTVGSIARRIWTFIFLRHFTEPEPRPGEESVHPRYMYSTAYGWIDAQHFFGFIDFTEQQQLAHAGDRQAALDAATRQGFQIEADQQLVRERVVLGSPSPAPAANSVRRLIQVRPPNTPLFRVPQEAAQVAASGLATLYGYLKLKGTQRELFTLLDADQREKFFLDSAKSAWSYEDPTSNQLGIQFFLRHGRRINALAPEAREAATLAALRGYFRTIGVVEDQKQLDELAARQLPRKERYEAPKTTEERERRLHPELYQLPSEEAR
jgi:hypothetical protein